METLLAPQWVSQEVTGKGMPFTRFGYFCRRARITRRNLIRAGARAVMKNSIPKTLDHSHRKSSKDKTVSQRTRQSDWGILKAIGVPQEMKNG